MKIQDFNAYKKESRKITMLTCYDHWSAQILAESNVDCLLVGDSVAMILYGEDSTLNISTSDIARHVAAVKKGAPDKFIIGDMPFLSYRKDLTTTMNNVEKLMKAGANSIKLEGAQGNLEMIEHIVASGVPVMGHLGLTPQMVHQLGGYKVQGKSETQAQHIKDWAIQLQNAGCYSLVLECVPTDLAKDITTELEIPTIGIGAGNVTDGQVLVLQDMLGAFTKNAKFVKAYENLNERIKAKANLFCTEVQDLEYPSQKESYS